MLRNLCPQYVVFQFHKGTIKPIRPILITFILIDFNSIKVQLSLLLLVHHEALSVFQFHKGTIKPGLTFIFLSVLRLFQFHKGTIKPELTQDSAALNKRFQFHKGTIKPRDPLNHNHVIPKISIP